jgi:diguanylate cyclase (GGDEF)-like protein
MPDKRRKSGEKLGLPEPDSADSTLAPVRDASSESETLVVRHRTPRLKAAPEHPCLITIHGPGLGRKVAIESDEFTIGRGLRNTLVVALGDISRTHCRITRRKGGLYVRDLGSTNGTYVNDELAPSDADMRLHSGDHVNLGGVIFKLLEGSNLESAYHEELYRTAIVDGLTQIYNRRYLGEFLEREMARALRHRRPLALLLIDVDEFKSINDRFGHLGGDQVLRELAATVAGQMRRETCFARYGGEEFAVVLPETDAESARLAGERVRGIVEAHDFQVDGHRVDVTVSIGVGILESDMQNPAELFHRADERLYEAKHAGRNRVSS